MAEIDAVKTITTNGDLTLTWADVTESDTFGRFDFAEVVKEISVHVHGTFGGATVVVKGSNYDAEGVTLSQLTGLAASVAAEALFSLLERPKFIQPVHSGGSSESVTVVMLVKR